MNLSGETKFFAGIVIATIAVVVGAAVIFSKPPKPVSSALLVPENAYATGSADAKVTLVEFSDFECPACGSAHPTVKQLVEKYKDQLKFVPRDFPLEQHKSARYAAEAARAAGAQGKYWQMHDALFENQNDLSQENIASLAAKMTLDMDKFSKEMNEGTYKAAVQKDIDDGVALGINATPTFFLNGVKLNLFNFAQLGDEIEKALSAAK